MSRRQTAHRTDGYSLIEMMVVVAVIAIVAGISVPVTSAMISRARSEGTGVVVATWLESARNRAVAERRNFEVTFDTGTNRIKVERVEPDLAKTVIVDYELPDDSRFMQFDGASDTPDLFGNDQDVEIEGDAPHMFTSDGSFVDANGDPVNGTIFMGKPGQVETGSAITFFGATGLIRTWHLAGTEWYQ
jgi:prepilin-type N-terminal cleavage/methylation domain-containing protein